MMITGPWRNLNAWEYCPRRFFLEYRLGEMADNEHILLGYVAHDFHLGLTSLIGLVLFVAR